MTMHFVQRSCSSLEDHISISSMMNHHFTLLGSGSECPKVQELLLTMVSYFKKKLKYESKREKNSCGRFPKIKLCAILAILPEIG